MEDFLDFIDKSLERMSRSGESRTYEALGLQFSLVHTNPLYNTYKLGFSSILKDVEYLLYVDIITEQVSLHSHVRSSVVGEGKSKHIVFYITKD